MFLFKFSQTFRPTFLFKTIFTSSRMAKSKFEYVKNFELKDNLLPNCWIVIKVDGFNFNKFSDEHNFDKPHDIRALNLMNKCANNVMEKFNDVIISVGHGDEYSFVFRKETEEFQRRKSKLESTIVSCFSSSYSMYWKEFFNDKPQHFCPVFQSEVILLTSDENMRDYLSWRQTDCHTNNLYDTCLWKLVKESGMSYKDAQTKLAKMSMGDKNELLFSQFKINYNNLPELYRKGTVLVREPVDKSEISEKSYKLKNEISTFHGNISKNEFWNERPFLLPKFEFGNKSENGSSKEQPKVKPVKDSNQRIFMSKSFSESIKKCTQVDQFIPNCWMVVRIDGRGFHKFSKLHNFEKPNDVRALSLMNKCATIVMENFKDIMISIGQSDEYSFVLRRETDEFQKSNLTSSVVSLFSSSYAFYWSEFFDDEPLLYSPEFDGRVVLYPTDKNIRDYLSWRQADCHINNLHNTCFYKLVDGSGMSPKDAQKKLGAMVASGKKDMLASQYDTVYNDLPEMFRKGSIIIREPIYKSATTNGSEHDDQISTLHCDIIGDDFWNERPFLLNNKS